MAASSTTKKTSNNHEKTMKRLQTALHDQRSCVLFLMGESGVGKTHMVNELKIKEHAVYDNIDEFLKNLATVQNQKCVLVLNEGNMYQEGFLDIYKAITEETNTFYYRGKHYLLPKDFHLIVTGNPTSYPGRHYHSFLQDYAETMWLKPLDDGFIIHKIILPILNHAKVEKEKLETYAQQILAISRIFPNYTARIVTLRDMQNLAWRFIGKLNKSGKPTQESFINACIDEFAYSISDHEKRVRFIEEVKRMGAIRDVSATANSLVPIEMVKLGKIVIPSSHKRLINIIREDLGLREMASEQAEVLPKIKPIVLLQGSSGLGKSTILRAVLEEEGYQKAAGAEEAGVKEKQITSKRYYDITGKGKEAKDLIQKAAREGAVVVVDEWNVFEAGKTRHNFEEFLNNLLDNLDVVDHGFMILASQNSAGDFGRAGSSKADINRTHFLIYDDYTEKDLREIAEAYSSVAKADVSPFVTDFFAAKKANPAVNYRTFFDELSHKRDKDEVVTILRLPPAT